MRRSTVSWPLATLRSRFERETGPLVDRVREAIAIANNEIHHAAVLRPEWNGMACVLTVVVVDETCAVVGHVGDTRLYKLRNERIDKITRDHSPIGEREDASVVRRLTAASLPTTAVATVWPFGISMMKAIKPLSGK